MQTLSVSKVTVLLVDWGCQFGGHNALNAPNPIPKKQETARDVKGGHSKGRVVLQAQKAEVPEEEIDPAAQLLSRNLSCNLLLKTWLW